MHATLNTPALDEQIAITERRLDQLRDEKRRRQQGNARALEQLDRRFRFNLKGTDAALVTLNRLIDACEQFAPGSDDQSHPPDDTGGGHPGDRWDGLS